MPRQSSEFFESYLYGSFLETGCIKDIRKLHSGPKRIPHRTMAPLCSRYPWKETTSTVSGTLTYSYEGNGLEVCHQVAHCKEKWSFDVPDDVQTPIVRIRRVRNLCRMPANIERIVRRQWIHESMLLRFELQRASTKEEQRPLPRISDTWARRIPVPDRR